MRRSSGIGRAYRPSADESLIPTHGLRASCLLLWTMTDGHKVTVTGGLGFIGSHVVDGLLAAGHASTIIDSMVAAVTDGREYDSHPRCIVHRESIADYFEPSGKDFSRADRVIHAASLRRAGRDPAATRAASAARSSPARSSSSRPASRPAPRCARSARPRSTAAAACSPRATRSSSRRTTTRGIEYAIAKTLTEAMTINSRAPRPARHRRAAVQRRRRRASRAPAGSCCRRSCSRRSPASR